MQNRDDPLPDRYSTPAFNTATGDTRDRQAVARPVTTRAHSFATLSDTAASLTANDIVDDPIGRRPSSTFSRSWNSIGPNISQTGEQSQPLPVNSPRSSNSGKRLSRTDKTSRSMISSPIKKPRTGTSPSRQANPPPSLGRDYSSSSIRALREGVSSPRSYSNPRSRHRSQLSLDSTFSSFSSMIPRPRDEVVSSVTTIKLPSANVRTASPAFSGSTPGSLASSSLDLSISTASPDAQILPATLQMLRGIGVIELLEQDDRPTFLVDLHVAVKSDHPTISILYHNASLRAFHEIHSLLAVELDGSEAALEFERFRAWVLYVSAEQLPCELSAPSYVYQGITWTKITLRTRFRFISGNINRNLIPDSSTPTAPVTRHATTISAAVDEALNSPFQSRPATPAPEVIPPDYFASASGDDEGNSVDRMVEDEMPTSCPHAQSGLIGDESQLHHPDEFTNQVLQSQPLRPYFDWTRIPLTDDLPDHIKFAKTVDWASTPLGPIEDWSSELRITSNLIMGSPHPAAMYWGPEQVAIYNAAYIDIAGKKHPELMGKRYEDAWEEIYDQIAPIFENAWKHGQATMKHDHRLFLFRNGYLEESFFSWSIVPLVGVDGEVVGLYNPAFEHTRRELNERRMITLREIGERISTAKTVQDFWAMALKGLEFNDIDIPLCMLYSVRGEAAESEVSSVHSSSTLYPLQLILEQSFGVPEGHPAAPLTLDLRTAEDGFGPYIKESLANGASEVVLSQENGTLPSELIEGFQWGGFGDPCRDIVIHPIGPTAGGDNVTGFLILGINPRRAYDSEYKLFVHLLSRQLATSLASVMLFEEEIRRGQRAAQLAALDRQELSTQLLLRTQEANQSEFRFTRMAEFAPVGMFIADSGGNINYCNDMWGRISGHSRSAETVGAWMDSVRNEDRGSLDEAWNRLLNEKVTISLEFRFKSSQQSGDNTIDTWVLMSAYPEKDTEGGLTSIFGCITDISTQKWAEKVQIERREEAVEMKRQQENFIDITSHEMRNPLSAILQCADQIVNNITSYAYDRNDRDLESLLEACVDAANTINLCASHQKRIVDDILTLSKLDSNLLTVTPIDDQPIRVVQRTLKMFESELLAHDIEFEFTADEAFEKMNINWARLDPSRLSQILINLMTNAIKFTQGREKRNIIVSLSASRDISEVTNTGTSYFPRNYSMRTTPMNIYDENNWGHGEILNIHCSVEDSGRGLSEEELKILFQRFQQATPRTHVQYGGSGLGLFISRILTEMQGGQIGVTSNRGEGSKFSFYIQCRRCLNPPAEIEQISPFRIARKTPPLASPAPASASSEMGTSSSPLPQLTIVTSSKRLFDVLIVEDNIVNQKVLQRQLRSCGNNIFVANHGKEALQTLEQSRFWSGREAEGVEISVILMDLEMPVMDGISCAKRIRELEREGTIVRHIPIIAVTAYARPEQIANAKAAGIDDVISKPFRIPELIPKMEELVGKYSTLSISAGS